MSSFAAKDAGPVGRAGHGKAIFSLSEFRRRLTPKLIGSPRVRSGNRRSRSVSAWLRRVPDDMSRLGIAVTGGAGEQARGDREFE